MSKQKTYGGYPPCVNTTRQRRDTSNNLHFWVTCPGCGKERWVPRYQINSQAGEKSKYLGLCRCCAHKKGEESPIWKGGRSLTGQGYMTVCLPEGHEFLCMAGLGNNERYILEHRLVVASHLKRPLLTIEEVHHKNGNKLDNRIENLELTTAQKHKLRVDALVCPHCGRCYNESIPRPPIYDWLNYEPAEGAVNG